MILTTITDMGYAYGYLLTSEIQESYHDMVTWILKNFTVCAVVCVCVCANLRSPYLHTVPTT